MAREQVKRVWLSGAVEDSSRKVSPLSHTVLVPKEHQRREIAAAIDHNLIITSACGAGKTLSAIEAARAFTGPKLIVCRKAARDQWEEAIWAQDNGATIYVAGPGGKLNKEVVQKAFVTNRRQPIWVIIHYEGLRIEWSWLAGKFWDVIVADEAHAIRNRGTQTALKLKQLLSRRKIGLTADLIEKSPADAWSPLNWIAPTTFRSYWQFFEEYVDFEAPPFGGRIINGAKRETADALGQVLSKYTLGHTKEEIAPDLPPLLEQYVPLSMDPAQAKLYTDLHKGSLLRHDATGPDDELFVPNHLARQVWALQLALDPKIMGYDAPSPKFDWIRNFCRDNPSEQIIILTNFRHFAKRLRTELGAALAIGGDATTLKDFLDGSARILVGTTKTLGESLNLQMAGTMIFADCHWSSTTMHQAKERIHRITITEPKHIIYLKSLHTIDELVIEAWTNKWSEAEFVRVTTEKWRNYA